MKKRLLLLSLLAVAVLPTTALARIKLITLPVRQRVEIQLDNPGATLVEEERIVPLVRGVNQVDFSWANTQIDPNTILFRVLPRAKSDNSDDSNDATEPLDVEVLSVSYPPGEAALVWQVSSSGSGSARVRISYLLGRLQKSFNYRAVASHDESTLVLSQYMRLENFAGERYASSGIWAGFGQHFHREVGLNETKQMLMDKFTEIPVEKTYTAELARHGYLDQPQQKLLVPMHYVLTNDDEHGLGQAPLPYGKVRIFQQDGRGSSAFLGEDWGQFTPLDDRMKLYVGVAQDIVVKRTIDENVQHRVAGNLYNREVTLKFEIENFKDKAVTLDIAEHVDQIRRELGFHNNRPVQYEVGEKTTFPDGRDKDESTLERLVFHVELPPRSDDGKAEKITHKLHLIFKNHWQ